MILNTDPDNKCVAYDLTDPEIEKFYKGAESEVSVLIDTENNIIRKSDYIPDWQAQDGQRVLHGVFSCYQFCQL